MPKVSSYDEATALDDDDILYVVQDGSSKKAKVGTLSRATRKAGLIGVPGTLGFGVGVCLEDAAGYTGLPGHDVIGHQNYGNYQYTDGSVMAWVPIFYYRIGHPDNPTYGEYGVNSIDIKGPETYADEAAANADGYALHRAFIDGGQVQPGFMHDKYLCSNNAGTASSIRNGDPLSTNSAHNPISGLTGSPANNYGGTWEAAKTRGSQFFVCSQFIRGAIAMLALAHAQASTTTTFNAWYDATNNWPKGCNNTALGDHADADVSYTSDGYSNCGKTGSGVPFAKTTHNGQESGICDINGPMWGHGHDHWHRRHDRDR